MRRLLVSRCSSINDAPYEEEQKERYVDWNNEEEEEENLGSDEAGLGRPLAWLDPGLGATWQEKLEYITVLKHQNLNV